MRREPIPDAVLRACACWREGPATDLITGGVLTDPEILQHLLSMVRADAGDLARELLELRGAARKALNVGGGLACYATLIAPDDHRKVAVMCGALHDDGSFGQATMMVPLEVENWSCAAADVGALLPKEPA